MSKNKNSSAKEIKTVRILDICHLFLTCEEVSDEELRNNVFPLHTSGHAYEEDIIKLCEIVNPEIIFPIHSENTGRFETLKEENKQKIKGKVIRLTSRKSVEI